MDWKRVFRGVLLFLVLVVVFFIIYKPHWDYKYPFHVDEWYHIIHANQLSSDGFNFFSNAIDTPVESGFQLILAFIGLFVPLVLFYKFLPAINVTLISIVLFYFLRRRYNYWVGLIAIVFLASLRSNVNILGLWFFVPVTCVIALTYTCFFLLDKIEVEPKRLFYAAGLLFLIAFIHQSSFLLLSLVVFIFFLFKYKFVLKNYLYFLPFLLLLFPAILMFIKMSGGNLTYFISKFVFGPGMLQINFNPLFFFGILSSIFAFIGFYFAWKHQELLVFRIYFVITLIDLLLFPFTNFTLFSAYTRLLYHFMVAAVPLAALGLYKTLKFVSTLLNKIFSERLKWLTYVINFFIVFCIILTIFHNYYVTHPNAGLYTLIDDSDYEAMMFLKEVDNKSNNIIDSEGKGGVLAPVSPGTAITAVSGRFSPSGLFFKSKEDNDWTKRFLETKCAEKKSMLAERNHFGFKYVYSYKELDCDFLNQVYKNKKVFIYEINE